MIRLTSIGAITALGLSPASASAKWVSNNGSTRGTVTVTNSGEFTYPAENRFKCPASEMKIQWIIQGSGQIKQQLKATTSGPNLLLQVKNWGPNCEGSVLGSKVPLVISECDFLMTQQEASTGPTIGTYEGCTVKMGEPTNPICIIQIPAGMEGPQGSGKGINVGLKKVVATNEGMNIFGKLNINEGGEGQLAGKGIFEQSVGTNALCPLARSTEEATIVGMEARLEGLKVE